MSDYITHPQLPPVDTPPNATLIAATSNTKQSEPIPAVPLALPAEAHIVIELFGRGLAPDADEEIRAMARDVWAQFAYLLAAAPAAPPPPPPPMPPTPMPPVMMPPPAPLPPPAPGMQVSPIAMAARALRQMTPDQVLDIALQRLRAKLPASAPVEAPKGIQFQLVPVTPG